MRILLIAGLILISPTAFTQNWFQKGLDIDGEYSMDNSGWAISMPNSNTIAIGARYNVGNGSSAGHARIYTWTGNSWNQKGLDIDSEAAQDQCGYSLSMPDSNTIAVGAIGNAGATLGEGHVRVFIWDGSAWVQKGLDIDGEAAGDASGFSVSMPDSNTVAIGSINNNTSTGHVRVYKWNGTVWSQKGLDIDGETVGDKFGWAVSMPDSNTIAIGAPNNDGAGNNAGHVRVYSWNGNSWIQKGIDIDGEAADDEAGRAVNMPDSNTIVIGAPKNDGNGLESGHVRVYSWDGFAWTQKGLDIDGTSPSDYFGYSVSMSDSNKLLIGAPINNNGYVRVYSWNGSTWIQSGVDILGESSGDRAGWSVDMADSSTFAFGAYLNNGVLNSNGGHCRVIYDCNSMTTDVRTECDSYIWIDGNTYTTSNNTATWTLQNINGCDSLVMLDLTITNSSTGTDVQTACGSYTWIDGNTYTSSNNTATWTIPNAAGCDSVITLDLTINPLPDNNVTQTGTLLEVDQAGATYQWLDCDDNNAIINGETNQSYTPATTGNYAVEVTLNGCADTSSCFLVDYTRMSEIYAQVISIHPNPTADVLTVKGLDQVVGLKGLEITSSNGEIVMTQEGMKKQLNVSALPTGIYFLNIIHESGTETIRFVKK